ncbi:MAG: hypothetical protein AABW89_01650 [Nanoarchaeota archaeon]
MDQEYIQSEEQGYNTLAGRLKDLEEKQRLLRDRILLIGKNLVEDRESMMNEIQEIKKGLFKTKEENLKIQEILSKVVEQLSDSARKEELMTLQRQIELFMTARGKN